jgi:quercetin dioxygenase-like cupin family protein
MDVRVHQARKHRRLGEIGDRASLGRGRGTRPHVHATGQVLHIVSGRGVVGDVDGRRLVEAGDVVVAQPGEWHWHGATPFSAMTHVTVQFGGPGSTDWDVDERDWGEDCPG